MLKHFPVPCVIVDIETTGGNVTYDRITEIGIIEVTKNGISEWSTLINPRTKIPETIQRLTGITNAMVETAPYFEQVAKEIILKLQGKLFIAHNVRFDYGFTAFFAHPLDSAFAMLLSCLSAYFILGASAEAAAWAVLFTGLFNFYIHSDTKSPFWLGYIVQRPEMHRIHHKRGYHANNYGIPLWDLLFGTYENAKDYVDKVGFSDEKTTRVYEMLVGIDVHKK